MNLLRRFSRRLRALLSRREFERDMAEEMRVHLDERAADYIAEGMSPVEASRAAQRKFGNAAVIQERCRYEQTWLWLESLMQDVRFAVRSLRKNSTFAGLVVLALSLGVGINTAIFSAVHSVLLKSLPYAAPEQLYSAEVVIPERREQLGTLPVRIQDYLEWRGSDTLFSGFAALRPSAWVITGAGESERLGGARVSTNFFSFLGVTLRHGRGFMAEEEQPGRDRVVVMSEDLWRRYFAADPTAVGRSVLLGGESHVIVGVAPSTLLMPTGPLLHPSLSFAPRIDVWKPIAPSPAELQGESWNHGLLVRLPTGAALEQGRQQLQARLNDSIRKQVPDLRTELRVQLVPLREIFSGDVRTRLLLVFAASALLLAIACANIANLFLARMARRSTEFATRVAIGASRGRILRQVAVEMVLLSSLGSVAGVGIAWGGIAWLGVHAPAEIRMLAPTRPDPLVLLFTLATAWISGIAYGAFPAWQLFKHDPAMGLREGGRSGFGGRGAASVRQSLVGVQMAMSTALAVTAALLLHSFVKVMEVDRGYDVDRIVAMDLTASGPRYAIAEQRSAFFRAVVERLKSLPGVQAVGLVSDLPATSDSSANQAVFRSDDAAANVVLQRPVAAIRSVTPGYFSASGTAFWAGREFVEEETIPAAVISESLAKRIWPGEPLPAIVGRTFRQGDLVGPLITVVGVVRDVRPGAVEREPPPQIYRPHLQRSDGRMTLVLRTSHEPSTLIQALRAEIKREDPNVPLGAIRTMKEIVSAAVVSRRFQMELTSLFAAVSLALGMIGIYGVVSYAVACQTRELGVRVALGASRGDIMRCVFAMGMKPVFIGLAAGLAASAVLARALNSMLFEVSPGDPLTLGFAVSLLLGSAVLACYLPARRAATIEPTVVLRYE